MASLQFQIHTDQENLRFSVSPSKRDQKTVSGIRGKTFQSGTPYANTTPRKALGDLNNRSLSLSGKPQPPLKNLSNTSAIKKPVQNILKPFSTHKENKVLGSKIKHHGNRQNKHIQKETNRKQSCTAPEAIQISSEQRLSHSEEDEIEYMPVAPKMKDDFEDIWPKKERVSTYIEKLINWRPPCLFGINAISDDDEEEDEEKKLQEMQDLIDSLPQPQRNTPKITEEDLKAPDCPPVSLDDISLPFIDETLVLPSMEESFSAFPHLEKLQLNVDY